MGSVEACQSKLKSLELKTSKLKMERDILQSEQRAGGEEVEVISKGYQAEIERLSGRINQLKQEKSVLKQQVLDLKLEIVQKENLHLKFHSPISSHPRKDNYQEDLLNRTLDDVLSPGVNRGYPHLQIAREHSSEKGVAST